MKQRPLLIFWLLGLAALMLYSSRQQEEAARRAQQAQPAEGASAAAVAAPLVDPQPAAPAAGAPVVYAGDLLLGDPAFRELNPEDQRDALRRRLKELPKPRSAAERRDVTVQTAKLHLTIAYLYDTKLPDGKLSAATEYARLNTALGVYPYAGQALLRAAELYLEKARETATKDDPLGDGVYVKKARRDLDQLSMGILRHLRPKPGNQPVQLWQRQGGEWVEAKDPYGAALKYVDDIANQGTVYRIIDLLVKMTGNIPGWSGALALIFLAIALKLGMYPLSRKSYESMGAMQKLQPVIEELRRKYKDNPQKLNEEMMRVYKEHGANPFAGCLPLLIQIPVFIFVYQGIRSYTYHFHDVKLLWIESLALPDLPLLLVYGVSMFVSQKITMSRQPTAGDPNQAQMQRTMSWLMPIMFTYMMYMWGLPSAFYLYWLAFNVLSTTEQVVTHRRKEAADEAQPGLTVVQEGAGPAARSPRAGRAKAARKKRGKRGGSRR